MNVRLRCKDDLNNGATAIFEHKYRRREKYIYPDLVYIDVVIRTSAERCHAAVSTRVRVRQILISHWRWRLTNKLKFNYTIFRGQSWRSGAKCDCKTDWLWVRSPLEEMKYLLKFIFPFFFLLFCQYEQKSRYYSRIQNGFIKILP